MVNHSDPHHPYKNLEGICTNAIEGIWGEVKRTLKIHNGIPENFLESHLNEFLFRFNLTNGDVNDVFWKLISGIANNWKPQWDF